MNITSPILASAARVAELPGDSVASLLKIVGFGTGLFDDSPDGGLGMIMSALSGVAAALAVANVLTFFFPTRYRSLGDIVNHRPSGSPALVPLPFPILVVRAPALAHLGV